MNGLLDGFMTRAALAGVGTALAAGPLGCFIVWRRMAYFGDAVAHAAVLGVALAFAFSLSIVVGTLIAALAMALAVQGLSGRGHGVDTLLGVMAHGSLAAGLVAVSFIQGVRVDLEAFLFGDILAVGRDDLVVIWGGAAVVVSIVVWRWSAMLTATLNSDLAYAAGIDPRREDLVLTLALAIVVAVSLQVIGALLITAMLIMPAAAARVFARTPERMAVIAAGIGCVAALGGLYGAYTFDTPAGPSIVVVAALVFAGAALFGMARGVRS